MIVAFTKQDSGKKERFLTSLPLLLNYLKEPQKKRLMAHFCKIHLQFIGTLFVLEPNIEIAVCNVDDIVLFQSVR